MTALPLPEEVFRMYVLCERDCLLLHIHWDLALSVCLSCTVLRWYSNTNALVWTAALPPQKEWCAGVGSSFWPPLKGNELLLEQLYHVLLLLFLTCTPSLYCGSLDTPDILYSPCTVTLERSLIKLTSKLPMTVLDNSWYRFWNTTPSLFLSPL